MIPTTTNEIFSRLNESLLSKLIPTQNLPIRTTFITDANEPIFEKSFSTIIAEATRDKLLKAKNV